MPKGKRPRALEPTLDDYITAATRLAAVVRQVVDAPGSVKRAKIVEALRRFERVDFGAM